MNTGIFSLGDFTITAAGEQDGVVVDALDGMTAVTVQLRFAYGGDIGGSPACRVYLKTSLDQGTTWRDIACQHFEQASDTAIYNFSGLTPVASPVGASDNELADDTAQDGILGDRLMVSVISLGTYTNSTLVSARVAVR